MSLLTTVWEKKLLILWAYGHDLYSISSMCTLKAAWYIVFSVIQWNIHWFRMKNSRTHWSLYLTPIDCDEVKKRLVNSNMCRYSPVEILRKDYFKILILKNGMLTLLKNYWIHFVKSILLPFESKAILSWKSGSGAQTWWNQSQDHFDSDLK